MSTGRRIAIILLSVVAVALLLVVLGVAVLTTTHWGRSEVRRIALDQLRGAVEGEVEIGRLEGSLLDRVILIDVSIVDSAGRPFVRADTVAASYSLRGLLSQRIRLDDLLFVNADVVLDRPPGEDWNFVQIFSSGDDVEAQPSAWGEWVVLRDLRLVNSNLTIATEWTPAPDLSPEEERAAVSRALAGETRDRVVVVPGGYQNVMIFRDLNAAVPRVIVAHPDTSGIPIEIERLSGIAAPFSPPEADVRRLSGSFRLQGDSLFFRNVEAWLPDSHVRGEGHYAMEHSDLSMELEGAPVAWADLRWLYPPLPEEGGGTLLLDLSMNSARRVIEARSLDLRVDNSEVHGRVAVELGDGFRLRDTNLRFSDFDTRLIEQLAPSIRAPEHGLLNGHLIVEGTADAMQVDGDVTLDLYRGGTSRVLATGEIGMREAVRFDGLELRMQPLRTDVVRAFGPDVPSGGTIEGRARLTGTMGDRIDLAADLLLHDRSGGTSRVEASGGVLLGEATRLDDLQLRLAPLRLDVIRPYAADLPPGATVSGPIRVSGPLGGMLQVDGVLEISDPSTGESRVAVHGGLALGDEMRFSNLDVRTDALQMDLVRSFVPAVRLGGLLTGTATLDGSLEDRLALRADIEHVEGEERSSVAASGVVGFSPGSDINLDVQLRPISLETAGRFAPQASLRGSARGGLSLQGSRRDLQIDGTLEFADGSSLGVEGRIDLESPESGYDIDAVLENFDPSAVSTRSPITTDIQGTLAVRGQGFEPASMSASIEADLSSVGVDAYRLDELRLDGTVDDGLVSIATLQIRSEAAEADVEGSFGLVAEREGVLNYQVRIDSLHTLAPWIPEADTTLAAPQLAAGEDLERASEQADPRDGTGMRAVGRGSDRSPLDTTFVREPLPHDSLAGSIYASGTLAGNVEQFGARGTAEFEQVVYRGQFVGSGQAEYDVNRLGTEGLEGQVVARAESMLISGHAVDSAAVHISYSGGTDGSGEVRLSVVKDEETDLRADTEFAMSLQRREIRIREMDLRLDTVRWTSTEPAMIAWGQEGVEIDRLDLHSSEGGRLYVNGTLPLEGTAELEVTAHEVEIGQFVGLLRQDGSARGRLTADIRLTGTRDQPLVQGTASFEDGAINGEWVPDLQAEFRQGQQELLGSIELLRDGELLAESDIRLPFDLALSGEGPRLIDQPMEISLRGGHIPLDVLPALTDQVQAVEGGIAVDLRITGTPERPLLEGDVALALESLVFVPLGVRFGPIRGHAVASEGVIEIDSLVAWSDGPTRITGTVQMESLTTPEFDLEIEARDAWVIDTDDARLQVDADLTVEGPLDRLAVNGLVRTQRGVIYVPELSEFGGTEVVNLDDPAIVEGADTLLQAQRQVVTEESEIVRNFEAEVEVEIDRDVWLRSTEANVEIYTPTEIGPLRIRMSGLREMPGLQGTINTDRGEYEYMSRRFTLTRGAVTFLEGEEIDPLLQVAAEHEVQLPGREPLTIRIVLSGTLRDLTINLESNAQPPISQSDLLSFLAFGREASTLIQGQGSSISGQGSGHGGLVGNLAGMATQQFTAIALESMLSGIEADLGRELGLDVIRITPANASFDLFSGSYLDVLRGTEIEAGRYVNSRLFVAAQARATTFPGLLFEYRTRRDFEWSATWRSRYIPTMPTLREPEIDAVGVLGTFLFKEWRF